MTEIGCLRTPRPAIKRSISIIGWGARVPLDGVIVVGVGVLKEMWDVSKLILLENPPGWDDSLCHADLAFALSVC